MNLKSILASTLLLTANIAFAADEEVEKLLSAMRGAYKDAKSAKLTLKSTMLFEEKEASTVFEATFKGPDKLYMYTDSMFGADGKFKVICDGKTIIVSSPEGKEELPYSIEELSGVGPVNLETLCFWDFKRQLNTGDDGNMRKSEFKISLDQDWNEKKWTILEETANEQGVLVKYWIEPKTHFIWKTEVADLATKTKFMTCEIQKMEIGLEVEDSLFGG
jgi:outer membrane lipoprotein-sorting protein